ncbi:MAG: LpxL/LpxP family Kdo(2)-lipid IV(A) lauroyl/palmitoleoyl acyltransferase [Dokdonella sp.]
MTEPSRPSPLDPRHWPAWIAIGIIRTVARLPYPSLLKLGRALGWLAARLLVNRRRIAEKNVALCLPELSEMERKALVEANLRDAGIMLVEFALAWFGSDEAIARVPVQVEGLERLAEAKAAGKGVLLVGAHFSHLELCARLVSYRHRIAAMYRVMDSPVFEQEVLAARLRYAEAMFTKSQLRQSVRYLRDGGVLWYAPDQDMRGKDSVFVPFFGVPASTISATHHLARMSGALVMPFFHRRLPNGGYVIRIGEPVSDFPSHDIATDTARINTEIEAMVRAAPDQYFWLHKRFKTRPEGTAPIY